jgi:WD40 repeat protein
MGHETSNQYRTLIAEKAALIVVDDVWNHADIRPLLAESRRSRILFTTRDASIGRSVGAHVHRMDLLEHEQACELLATWSGLSLDNMPSSADEIIAECGRLPLALSVIGSLLSGGDRELWTETLDLLRSADISAIEDQLPEGQQTFFKAVKVSFQQLKPEIRKRYSALAVLPEDVPASLPILQTLWDVNRAEARRTSRILVDRSLAQAVDIVSSGHKPEDESASNEKREGFQLHDLQLDYIRALWSDREALAQIREAVRLSVHVIERDPDQFVSQVVGRLLGYDDSPSVKGFVERIALAAPKPWPRLIRPALISPGTLFVRKLIGHSNPITALLAANNRTVISTARDEDVKVWDLKRGRELLTLPHQTSDILCVAVTPDSRRVVCASEIGLTVWDLETGLQAARSDSNLAHVTSLAITPDGRRALATIWFGTATLWDLENCAEARRIQICDHVWDRANVLGFVPRGDGWSAMLVANTYGETRYKTALWHLDTGEIDWVGFDLHCNEKHHRFGLRWVATPDGHRAAWVSSEGAVKVANLNSVEKPWTLTEHAGDVTELLITPDGRTLVIRYGETKLRVWDIQDLTEIQSLEAFFGELLAVTPDGNFALSNFGNHIKVWNLTAGSAPAPLKAHSTSIKWLVASLDGRLVVSMSRDEIKVWETDTGREIHRLSIGESEPRSFGISADGNKIIWVSGEIVSLWNRTTSDSATVLGPADSVGCLSVSPDGRLAAWSHAGALSIYDFDEARVVLKLFDSEHKTFDVCAFTPDVRQVCVQVHELKTGAYHNAVWDIERKALRKVPHGDGGNFVFTRDGRTISYGYTLLTVYDAEGGNAYRSLKGHTDTVTSVAVEANGHLAVSGSWDCSVRIWDLDSYKSVCAFTCDDPVTACVFARARSVVVGDCLGGIYFLLLQHGRQDAGNIRSLSSDFQS